MALGDMSFYYPLFLIWFITAFLVHLFIKSFKPPTQIHAPPSPPALPLIGHLHLIGSVLPKSFQELAGRYGPLMEIRLGASTCVVASNATVAKEIFKTHDLNFSSRPEFGSSEYFIYRGSRFVTAQYGDYWRFMKKLRTGKKLVGALTKYDRLVERIMKEHEEKAKKGLVGEKKDLLDILLEIYNDPEAEIRLSRNDIKSFLLDLFFAGTDTSSAAMQWAMGELINCPRAFNKLREEINTVVGPNRLIKESDVQNLPYLRAVIKETLRLHPSAPLIIRECAEDCKINGSIIKAKTRVLVNVFAVMRDKDSWANPGEFLPERFMESSKEKIGEHQMEFKGQNFRYLPFGSGRRGCPGASLAMLVMHAAVGALVQCFDWKVEDGDKVDLRLGSGFAAEMAKPLVCYPIKVLNI